MSCGKHFRRQRGRCLDWKKEQLSFVHWFQMSSRLPSCLAVVIFSHLGNSLLDDAESCMRRSQDTFDKIVDAVGILEGMLFRCQLVIIWCLFRPSFWSRSYSKRYVCYRGVLACQLTHTDIKQFDASLRNDVLFITNIKVCCVALCAIRRHVQAFTPQNSYTEQCLGALRRVSILNNDLVKLPPALSDLQARLRGKNSFSHIQRLHNMLYAYGATVIEIVRRKEFGKSYFV